MQEVGRKIHMSSGITQNREGAPSRWRQVRHKNCLWQPWTLAASTVNRRRLGAVRWTDETPVNQLGYKDQEKANGGARMAGCDRSGVDIGIDRSSKSV